MFPAGWLANLVVRAGRGEGERGVGLLADRAGRGEGDRGVGLRKPKDWA